MTAERTTDPTLEDLPAQRPTITGTVISGGQLAAAITAIGALILSVVVAIVKLAAIYQLTSDIPSLRADVAQLKTDVELLKQQTSRDTLTDIVRSVRVTETSTPDPERAIASLEDQTPAPQPQTPADVRQQLEALSLRIATEEARSQQLELALASTAPATGRALIRNIPGDR